MGKKRALETQVQFGGKLKLRTKERKLNSELFLKRLGSDFDLGKKYLGGKAVSNFVHLLTFSNVFHLLHDLGRRRELL
jgi:hypothetical protein